MKKTLLLFVLFALSVAVFSQEPANNLRKTIPELRSSFPDLVQWGSAEYYKSPEANILFTVDKGKVVREFTIFEGEEPFLKDLYQNLLVTFSKNVKGYLWGNNKNSISFFYSYFYVYISYEPYENVSISYVLNGYS